ncbi:hypothetical protein TNCV_989891 [Trichonephila clavipes]|nr:hypothetical protein TNCV_989891 [Trichonephila clavipes]
MICSHKKSNFRNEKSKVRFNFDKIRPFMRLYISSSGDTSNIGFKIVNELLKYCYPFPASGWGPTTKRLFSVRFVVVQDQGTLTANPHVEIFHSPRVSRHPLYEKV